MNSHVGSVIKAFFVYHLHVLSQLRPVLNMSTANAVVVSLIKLRMNYCTRIMWESPQNQIERVQKEQNAAALIVFRMRKKHHIEMSLSHQHSLPLAKSIEHKFMSPFLWCMNGSEAALFLGINIGTWTSKEAALFYAVSSESSNCGLTQVEVLWRALF